MDFFIYILLFIFGLMVGSFLNCVIYRLGKGNRGNRGSRGEVTSPLHGRSYCPHCKHILKWYDLVPVLSFILLKRKCRYCSKKISWQYPAVEIATGLLFLLIFNFVPPKAGFNEFFLAFGGIQTLINTLFFVVVVSFLVVIFVYDLKHFIIPDKVIYPLIAITFLFKISNLGFVSDFGFRISDLKNLVNLLSAAFGAGLFFLLIVLGTRGRGMGIGDIKLAFFMGLFLGFPNILTALFFAFAIGAIMGIGLILLKRKTLKSEVPFGPFLVIGTFIAFFWGKEIINWYFSLFF